MHALSITITLIVSVASIAWANVEFDEKHEGVVMQQDVRRLLGALYAGDIDTLLKYSYPAVVAAMGGHDAAKTTLAGAVGQLQTLGMKVESLVFPEAPTFIQGNNGRRYAIVPTKSVVSAKGQQVQSYNFQLGVKEANDSQWTYLEGSRMTPQVLSSMFPDFPSGYQLPKISREKL